VADILAWRERIASKYRDQLGEELAWDERSTFEVSEDVATSGDVLFRYAAAVLDQRGKSGFSNLLTTGKPPSQEIDAVFAEASRRGFGGRFPQLLLGASVWLPFETNLMIEEPNWNGVLDRYGSGFCLVDEVTSVRAAIAEAYPAVATYDATKASPEQTMVAAWQTSDTILRLAAIAVSRHLPMWTTG
jgi:hypothetical protein